SPSHRYAAARSAPVVRSVISSSSSSVASASSLRATARIAARRRGSGVKATRSYTSRRGGQSNARSTLRLPESRGPARILPAVKLILAIIHNEDAGALVEGLLEKDFRATRLHSSGGFLKQSNATIVLGVEDDQVEVVMAIIT